MLAHVAEIAAATGLPVSADLENGFGDDPKTAGETIRLAAAAGVVGGSIEDSVNRPGETVYELAHAVDRVRAAVEAARALAFPFTLTARCENYLLGIEDLKDTIRRLQAYQEAGANVLYAPCITSREDITAVVRAVDRPVNFLMGTQPQRYSLEELSEMGVRRVSVGSALATTALGAFLRGAREMKDQGTFNYTKESAGFGEVTALLRRQ
jgi:2-methylisocitrate lyase-like PEP mutase family enzyme